VFGQREEDESIISGVRDVEMKEGVGKSGDTK
jgi:hypothetical protein